MLRSLGRCGLLLAASLGLSACASLPFSAGYTEEGSEFGRAIPPEAADLVPGAATDRDVLETLGPPAQITALSPGYAFLYETGEVLSQSVGVSVFSLRAGYAWDNRDFSAAAFVFNDDGELLGAAIDRSDTDGGSGFAIGTQRAQAGDQLIYMLPSNQHAWGRRMLRPAPLLLNEQSTVTSGEHGLERRGTTSRVGQHTLASGFVTPLGLLQLLREQTGQ